MNTRLDKRVKRTRRLLQEALVALTLEKEYEEITIQDITGRADIGYRTFFRHYSDKDALLQETLAATMMELRELMAPPPSEAFVDPGTDIQDFSDSTVLFRHIQEHCDLYRVLLRSERAVVESAMEFAISELKSNFRELPHTDVPFGIIANHIVGSTFALVRWWLDNEMKYSPEKMGEYHMRYILNPTRQAILAALTNEPDIP
jgi:AcrR family transcriptional regulator